MPKSLPPGSKVNKKRTVSRPLSRFGRFIKANRIKPGVLADVSGVTRNHVYRLRFKDGDPQRLTMIYSPSVVARS
jgi:hypothetical protein